MVKYLLRNQKEINQLNINCIHYINNYFFLINKYTIPLSNFINLIIVAIGLYRKTS